MSPMSFFDDPLFGWPFLTGLGFAILLPLFGAYLRLRDEWLAALAYAHVAAAGALAALALGLPLAGGGLVAAAGGAVGKRLLAPRLARGAAYALLLLIGWSGSVLLTANLPMAERLGHALFDGQLYFADRGEAVLAAAWLGFALPALAALSRRLLLLQVYPDHHRAQGGRAWPVHLAFDLLAAGSLALATMAVGVMGGFALVFIPPWVAFLFAGSWRRGLLLALAVGLGGYVAAFSLALSLDQPFGPTLALSLAVIGLGGLLWPRRDGAE